MGKQPTRVRRTFTPRFKKDAVRLVNVEGKSVNEIATNLGIARSLLQRWTEQLATTPREAFPGWRRSVPREHGFGDRRRSPDGALAHDSFAARSPEGDPVEGSGGNSFFGTARNDDPERAALRTIPQ